MRILITGLLVFIAWSTFSTYIYVCKIKGLCYEPIAMQVSEINHNEKIVADTLSKPQPEVKAIVPKVFIAYFDFDKSEFYSNEESEKYFIESKNYLDQNLEARLSIIGHTDATGTISYNQALGFRRAQSLQHYFESKGMLANKIIIESKGENEPVSDNKLVKGRTLNRRTVITIKK